MMMLLVSGIGVEVSSVSLVLKEPQSDAVELKPWMTIFDFYCRLTHCQKSNDTDFALFGNVRYISVHVLHVLLCEPMAAQTLTEVMTLTYT